MHFKKSLVGLTLIASSLQGLATTQANEYRFIVKYRQPVTALKLSKQLNAPVKSLQPIAGGAYVIVIDAHAVKNSSEAELLTQLKQNLALVYAVKDRVGHFKPLPKVSMEESFFPITHQLQWDEFAAPGGVMLESAAGLRDGAWAYTTGHASQPIVVAVLDTGIAEHPALKANLLRDSNGEVLGWNFAANNRDLTDETKSFHGTHVAGTIAALGDEMTGVGEDLKILPLKIPDASGMFYESQVVNAIYWAVGGKVPGLPVNPYPAKVLNMSFGVDKQPGEEIAYCDEALQSALDFSRNRGAVAVVAAGNDNHWESYNAPAVCNGTIKVASTGPQGLRAYYSNYGPGVSFAAPGGDLRYGRTGGILSTVKPNGGYQGSGYDFYQGTSMASPHAAGVAALVYAARDGRIKPLEVEQILYVTTHAFGESEDTDKSCVGKKPCGHGILDAESAVKTALANYDVIFSAPKINHLPASCNTKQHILMAEKQSWLMQAASCRQVSDYTSPVIKQSKNGEIIANYGKVSYVLNTTNYSHCDIIGVDGVGCNQ